MYILSFLEIRVLEKFFWRSGLGQMGFLEKWIWRIFLEKRDTTLLEYPSDYPMNTFENEFLFLPEY